MSDLNASLFLLVNRIALATGWLLTGWWFARAAGDVLVGLVLGAVVTLIGYRLLRGLLAATVARLATTRLRPLLTTVHADAGSAAVS